MKIINETNLCYAELGLLIDSIMKSNTGNTMYYGKVEWFDFKIKDIVYICQIRYFKKYVEWSFIEK